MGAVCGVFTSLADALSSPDTALGRARRTTLVDAGALVALGADDPLLFGSRLVDQYEIARSAHGFTDTELAALASSSIRASRASSSTKARLLADVGAWLLAPDPAETLDALRAGGTVTIG